MKEYYLLLTTSAGKHHVTKQTAESLEGALDQLPSWVKMVIDHAEASWEFCSSIIKEWKDDYRHEEAFMMDCEYLGI